MRPVDRVVAGLPLALALLVAACGSPPPSLEAPPSPSSPATPGTGTAAPTPTATPATSPSLVVDATLLDQLPADLDGVARQADPETAADIAADGALAEDAEALAVALYVGPLPSDDTALDYAVATVVRTRPGVADAAWFRSWRETFDAGVCEQAGGVDPGRSEFELDGRTVHRSTCRGGVTIYHVLSPATGVVVSIQGGGDGELGRAIVEDLAE